MKTILLICLATLGSVQLAFADKNKARDHHNKSRYDTKYSNKHDKYRGGGNFEVRVYSPRYYGVVNCNRNWDRRVYNQRYLTIGEENRLDREMEYARNDFEAIELAEYGIGRQALTVQQLKRLMRNLRTDEARLDLVYIAYPNLLNPELIPRLFTELSPQAVRQIRRDLRY